MCFGPLVGETREIWEEGKPGYSMVGLYSIWYSDSRSLLETVACPHDLPVSIG